MSSSSYRPGEDFNKDSFLWKKRGFVYSRVSLLNLLFHTDRRDKKTVKDRKKNVGYKDWFISFDRPVYDKRISKHLSFNNNTNYKDSDFHDYLNELKEPFSLFASDESDRKMFIIIPKKNNINTKDFDVKNDLFYGFYLLCKSSYDAPGTYGKDEIEMVEVSPKDIERFFPRVSKKKMESFSKNHPVSRNEIRLKIGKYKKMVETIKTRKNYVPRIISINKFWRTKRMTTGRIQVYWEN